MYYAILVQSLAVTLRTISLAVLLASSSFAAEPADAVRVRIDIDKQPLASALNEFARQSDREILFSSDIVRDKEAQLSAGVYEPEEALELLLADTGLGYSVTANNTFLVGGEEVDPGKSRPASSPVLMAQNQTSAQNQKGRIQETESESNDNGRGTEIEEILVTATKRATALGTTPLAVTVFDQQELTRRGVVNIRDLQLTTPGLLVAENGRTGAVQLSLRGIYSSNDTEFGSPAVGFHQDGVYNPRPTAGYAMIYDVERVELLRGPQGTLFGRNSTVGTINVISKRPDLEEWGGFLEYGAGNYDSQGIRSTLNVPLVEGRLGMRFNYAQIERDGWVDQRFDLTDFDGDGIVNIDQRRNRQVGRNEYYYNQDNVAWRAALQFEPTDELSFYAAYDKFRDRSAGSVPLKDCDLAAGTPAACAPGREFEPLLVNVPGDRNGDDELFRLVADFGVSRWFDVSYLFGYQDLRHNPLVDVDGGQGRFTPWNGTFAANGDPVILQNFGQDRFLQWQDTFSESRSHELQFKSQGDGRFNWIVGLFTFDEEGQVRLFNEEPTSFGFDAGGVINGPFVFNFQTDDIDIESEAAFAQIDFGITDRLNLTAGIRRTEDRLDFGFQAAYTNNNPPAPELYFDPARPVPADGGIWYESTDFVAATRSLSDYPVDSSTPDGEPIEFSKNTWRLGVDYNMDALDNAFIYGFVATGYRQGNLTITIPRTFVNFVPTEFFVFKAEPEEVRTIELGFKGRLLDDRLGLRVALYQSDYENYQLFDFVDARFSFFLGPPTTPVLVPLFDFIVNPLVTQNVGDVEFLGLEVEYDFEPWENGRFSGNFVWSDNEIDSFTPVVFAENWFCDVRAGRPDLSDCVPDADLSGNRLPRTPEVTGSLTYQHDLSLFGLDISPRVTLNFSSSFFHSITNYDEGEFTSKEDGYENLGASIRLSKPGAEWYVDLWGDNLNDEQHKIGQNVAPARAGNTGNLGLVLGEYTAPRTFGIRLGVNF